MWNLHQGEADRSPRLIGWLRPLPRDGYGELGCLMKVTLAMSQTSDSDPTRTYPVRAPQTRHSSHRGNFTNPHFTFLVHDHSFIHSSIHSSHTSKHCICNCCITTLRVVSRSGSRLIRYERRSTEVPRLARKGLKAASRQTEPGEKMQMSPSGPCSTRSEADRVISTISFDPNLKPSPQNVHRGKASGSPESISGMTRASVGRWVKEQ